MSDARPQMIELFDSNRHFPKEPSAGFGVTDPVCDTVVVEKLLR